MLLTAKDWNNESKNPYALAKIKAEKEAWQMAEYEAKGKELEGAPDYQALLAEGGELGLFNSLTDSLHESLY